MTQLSNPLLKECAVAFKSARGALLSAVSMLYTIRQDELYSEAYTSFSEYCEEECGISRGYASKILAVYEHYVLEGNVLLQNLEKVDADKLYAAMKLPGTPEKQLSQALTLSRSELRQEREEVGDHEHAWICRICGIKHP